MPYFRIEKYWHKVLIWENFTIQKKFAVEQSLGHSQVKENRRENIGCYYCQWY